LLKTLEQLIEFFGAERNVSVSRELTKLHEETFTGNVKDVLTHFSSKEVKGEIVIVIDGKKE
jgi:16S rRNA (cytidine1402-2'-O)-methyltransferase